MEKIRLNWHLINKEDDKTIKRYCHNCSKIAMFKDSGIRRHNANGKNIHAYAIFKCDKDHTWNEKLAKYKAQSAEYSTIKDTDYVPQSSGTTADSPLAPKMIPLAELQQQGALEVEILLAIVQGKWRLDKLLAQRLIGVSRSEIVKGINGGKILLNNKQIKPKEVVQVNQLIWIDIAILQVSF